MSNLKVKRNVEQLIFQVLSISRYKAGLRLWEDHDFILSLRLFDAKAPSIGPRIGNGMEEKRLGFKFKVSSSSSNNNNKA